MSCRDDDILTGSTKRTAQKEPDNQSVTTMDNMRQSNAPEHNT
jgi:hypothetical protein